MMPFFIAALISTVFVLSYLLRKMYQTADEALRAGWKAAAIAKRANDGWEAANRQNGQLLAMLAEEQKNKLERGEWWQRGEQPPEWSPES